MHRGNLGSIITSWKNVGKGPEARRKELGTRKKKQCGQIMVNEEESGIL